MPRYKLIIPRYSLCACPTCGCVPQDALIAEFDTLAEISAAYCERRDAAPIGASRFPEGVVHDFESETGGTLHVSYNGRIWSPIAYEGDPKRRPAAPGKLLYCPSGNVPAE